eukprot:Hpha_TRINITY_DN14998_c1_g1::TRINITY_DN14998_c1_g1_i1::g.145070::m.145070
MEGLRAGVAASHHRRGKGLVEAVEEKAVVVRFVDGAVVRYSGSTLRDGRLSFDLPTRVTNGTSEHTTAERANGTLTPGVSECSAPHEGEGEGRRGSTGRQQQKLEELLERRAERQSRLEWLEHRLAVIQGSVSKLPTQPSQSPNAALKIAIRKRACPVWPPLAPLPPWWDPENPHPPVDLPAPMGPPLVEQLLDAGQRAELRAIRAELATRVGQETAEQFSEDELRRFCTARKWERQDALANLEELVEWRRGRRQGCEVCEVSAERHFLFLTGWDRERRPVMYSCFLHNKDREVRTMLQHAVWTMELCAANMPHDVSNWVQVVNFAGFGVADANPMLAKDTAKILQRFFPARLAAIVLVDPPWAFQVLLRAVRTVASERTMKKVRTVTTRDGTADKAFAELFDPPLAAYLMGLVISARDEAAQRPADK